MVADQYPYTACGGGITGLLMPRWAQEGGREQMLRRLDEPVTSERLIKEMLDTITKLGGPEKLQIRAYAPNPEFEGLLLSEVCEITKKTPIDQVVEMARKGNASLVSHILNEDDMLAFARHPAVTAGSDGSSLHVEGPLSKGHPHPRDFGTFPRAFRLFHREHKLYSLEEAVRKLTSMPAQAVGLKKRGLLREGMWADVIVFDPEKFTDTATYKQPKQLAEGIDWAIVNGVSAIAEARFLGNTPGRPITSQDE